MTQAAEDQPIADGVRSLIVPDPVEVPVRRTGTGRPSYPGSVTDEGLVFPRGAAGAVTMSLDGNLVWSLQPDRDGERRRNAIVVKWPQALGHRLDGVAQVTVKGHGDGPVYVEDEFAFGTSTERLALVNSKGVWLQMDKVGNLSPVMGKSDPEDRRLTLEASSRICRELREIGGVEGFLNYGALLGLIREGRILGHDTDIDLAYLSTYESPADIMLESFRLQRVFHDLGYHTIRMSAADFKVVAPLTGGRETKVDIFGAFILDGIFYQLGNRSGRLAREQIVPTQQRELEGYPFAVPAEPEAMLTYLYGPTWHIPDPAFRFYDAPDGVRRLDGWLRGFRNESPNWNRFFRTPDAKRVPLPGSSFAAWTRPRIGRRDVVVDLGCGNGRDSAYFARRGHRVVSYDGSPEARVKTRYRVRRAGGGEPDTRHLLVNDMRTVAVAIPELARVRAAEGRPLHLYGREFIDSFDAHGRRNLWRMARALLRDGGFLFLEFSAVGPTPAPPPGPLVLRVDADRVVEEIAAYGGHVVVREEGPGQDLYDEPDPWVCRLQVSFSREEER